MQVAKDDFCKTFIGAPETVPDFEIEPTFEEVNWHEEAAQFCGDQMFGFQVQTDD